MTWRENAQCGDLPRSAMYPVDETGNTDDKAEQAVADKHCTGCPAINRCLAIGLSEEFGVWGGKTTRQRRKMRREGFVA